ncbi:YdcF family protein [Enterococcus sp. LJL98]
MLSIYFLLCYSFVSILLYYWQQRKNGSFLMAMSLWTLLSFPTYLGLREYKHGTFFISVPFLILFIFLVSYYRKKTRLFNGFLFNLFLVSFALYLVFYYIEVKDWLVFCFLLLFLLLALFVLFFGSWSLILLLYWNARIMIRREGRSLGNLLTLLLALALTFLSTYNLFFSRFLPDWLAVFFSILPFALVYFTFLFLNFLTISIIYQFNRPRYQQDYIIVLGAGLLNGDSVTPLLAQRIDRALAFYNRQKEKTGQTPKILFSGGQGPDEKIPEALAMRNYAIAQGYPTEDLLTEEQSTTTFENMKFSKELIEKQQPLGAKVIFSSNNYHIFRAGIYAQKNQLKADGIGSKTAFYYLPTAFLREFIAIIAMQRRIHFLFLGCSTCVFLLLAVASFLSSH